MAKITLRPTTDADCVELAETLRLDDRNEIEAGSGRPPLDVLRDGLRKSSHSVTAADERGRVICIFGVGSVGFLSNIGCPWLIGSDLLDVHWRLYVRLSRKYLSAMLDLYPHLLNMVDARNHRSIRLIRYLGFEVSEPLPIGRDGAMFRVFEMRRDNV